MLALLTRNVEDIMKKIACIGLITAHNKDNGGAIFKFNIPKEEKADGQ